MRTYVGYGFDADDITNIGLLLFMQRYAPEDARRVIVEAVGVEMNIGDLTEEDLDQIGRNIDEIGPPHSNSRAEYIADLICKGTCAGLVWALDDRFVIFPAIEFPDDAAAKAKFVKNATDFQALINRYFPEEDIEYGKLWEGVDIE